MKNYLWTLVKKYFAKEIQAMMPAKEDPTKRMRYNYPVGTKVIVRSNEPDDLFIGTIISHEVIHEQLFLSIQDENGKVICPMSEPAHWTQEREDALRKLSWHEQLNVMNKFYGISKEDAERKESPAYKNRLA